MTQKSHPTYLLYFICVAFSFLLYSVFSLSCLRAKIASVHPLPFLKPICASLSRGSTLYRVCCSSAVPLMLMFRRPWIFFFKNGRGSAAVYLTCQKLKGTLLTVKLTASLFNGPTEANRSSFSNMSCLPRLMSPTTQSTSFQAPGIPPSPLVLSVAVQ